MRKIYLDNRIAGINTRRFNVRDDDAEKLGYLIICPTFNLTRCLSSIQLTPIFL